MKKFFRNASTLFLRCFAVLFLSLFLPTAGLSFYGWAIAPERFNLPAVWYAVPQLAGPFILFSLLSFGVPSAIGVFFLRRYPERVMFYPFACALIPMFIVYLFFGWLGIAIPIGGLILQSILFLTLPLLKPGGRLGKFERIPFPAALTGFTLCGGSGSFLLSVILGFSSREALVQILLPLLTSIGFLLIWYGGTSLYKVSHPLGK